MGIFGHHATFKGGKVLPGKKHFSRDAAIEIPPLPGTVVIPLWQHAGSPAQACVAPGRRVRTGERIGKPDGALSAAVHASISGTVTAIGEISLPGGKRSPAVVIESDGRDEHAYLAPLPDGIDSAPSVLLDRIDEAGIVGLGGAAFPAKVKLSPPRGKKADVLLINGAECEPYLTADYRLMVERAPEVVAGIRILLRVLGISRAIIGVERHSGPAIKMLEKAIGNEPAISLRSLQVKYPQGAEKILIKSILGREVPSGGLPIDVGAIVHNIGTAEAIYKAVVLGQPLIERVITVSGEAIPHPKNVLTRIGTPIGHLLDLCGGFSGEKAVLIAGGPMMGMPLESTDIPVFKGLSGVLALPRRSTNDPKEIVCINCGRCFAACPFGLNPAELSELGDQGFINEAMRLGVTDCCNCGLCTTMCPGGRNNAENIKALKEAVLQRKPS
jgi:Na+-translocating ferredoxin:NAD+ oxidoreductase subunit C